MERIETFSAATDEKQTLSLHYYPMLNGENRCIFQKEAASAGLMYLSNGDRESFDMEEIAFFDEIIKLDKNWYFVIFMPKPD